jgi:hypothetical protein
MLEYAFALGKYPATCTYFMGEMCVKALHTKIDLRYIYRFCSYR